MTKRKIALLMLSVLLILERLARGSHTDLSLFERELAVMVGACIGLVIQEWWKTAYGLREDLKLIASVVSKGEWF